MKKKIPSRLWEAPRKAEPTESLVNDPSTGEDYPGCTMCEWCCRDKAEFHEPNHDRMLCRQCAHYYAPRTPVPAYQRVAQNLYSGFPNLHRFTTNRLAIHVAEILFTTQGGNMGCLYDHSQREDITSPSSEDVRQAAYEICFETFHAHPVDWTNTHFQPAYYETLSDEATLEFQYAFYKRRCYSGWMVRDFFLSALYHLFLCSESVSDKEARFHVLQALRFATKHLKRSDKRGCNAP